jgi:hypothetical protein
VFNPKVSGIVAGVAFILSLLIGLFTGSQFLTVFFRALILGVIFFVLVSLAYWLVSQFLPELLVSSSDESGENDAPGSQVDISVDASTDSLEDISDMESPKKMALPVENLASSEADDSSQDSSDQGLYQKPQDDYNEKEEGNVSPSLDAAVSAAVPAKETSGSVNVLPDLESMSGSFALSDESDEGDDEESAAVEIEDEPSSTSSSASPQKRKTVDPGEFDVQGMASAIQTILKREQKG